MRRLISILPAAAAALAAGLIFACSPQQAASSAISEPSQVITVPEGPSFNFEENNDLKTPTPHTSDEFREYHDINSDFAGVFEIPALDLKEVAVTCPPEDEDNNYYLRKQLNREYRYLGILFFDFRNLDSGGFDRNNIIYGHHIPKFADQMFGKLVAYRDGSTYLTADLMKFTAYNGYTYYFRLFSAYPFRADTNNDPYFYIVTYFDEDTSYHYTDPRRYEHYTNFLNECVRRSEYKTDVELHFYDKILTLVTCIYDKKPDAERYVVHAKLMHTDEIADYLTAHPEYIDANEIIGNPAPF